MLLLSVPVMEKQSKVEFIDEENEVVETGQVESYEVPDHLWC